MTIEVTDIHQVIIEQVELVDPLIDGYSLASDILDTLVGMGVLGFVVASEKWHYRCEEGHHIQSEELLARCPAMVHSDGSPAFNLPGHPPGSPCDAEIVYLEVDLDNFINIKVDS